MEIIFNLKILLQRLLLAIFYSIGLFSPILHAQETIDLISLYQEALRNDSLLSSARFQNEAAQELVIQGKSLFLPSIIMNASFDNQNKERKFLTPSLPSNDLLSGKKTNYKTYDYGVTIKQPLFDYSAYAEYKKILTQTSLSDKQLINTQQDLIFRISKSYFETLLAKDQVDLFQYQRAAIQEQLSKAEAQFEVGLISVTDINEAKTKKALIEAQQISAVQKFKIKKREIQIITGKLPGKLTPLNPVITFTEINNLADEWISMSQENNIKLQIKKDEIKIAESEIDSRRSGHYPTINAIASRSRNWDKGGYPYGATKNEGMRSYSDSIGVEISIPIFSGGMTSSRIREAVLLKSKLEEDIKYLRKEIELQVRDYYLSLQTNFSEISAYQQAMQAATLQLESTQLGFQEGLRNSVEVLDAQQILFNAKLNVLESRYNYIMNFINLKLSVGMLSIADLDEINQYLMAN
ncbi:TolC family outer membrane protein [Methylophilaceae bacterium]|nr:TolC family outer membrane protein [Methylophilaceae bacterium]|tara:strand:+ start:261 stop:1658 length:1398 start_codon:yes stop_codon:yes gene_type:complete